MSILRISRMIDPVLISSIFASALTLKIVVVANLALPSIQQEFDLSATQLQWVVTSFMLPLGAFILTGGALGDHYGHKRIFGIGLWLFMISSFVTAVAPDLEMFLAARIVQGIGAALIVPTSLAVLAMTYSGAARARAIGSWASATAILGALAPILAGWILDAFGWRICLAVFAPLSLITLILGHMFIAEKEDSPTLPAPLDWLGTILTSAFLAALIWWLTNVSNNNLSILGTLAQLGAIGLLLVLWIKVARYKAAQAMLPLKIFRQDDFLGITVITFILYMAIGGFLISFPYVLITIYGFSGTGAGAILMPFSLIIGTISRGGTKLALLYGDRSILTTGSLIVAAGFAWLAQLPLDATNVWLAVLPGECLLAVGMGILVAPLTTSALNSVETRMSGIASGVNTAAARVGTLFAGALLGITFTDANQPVAAAHSGLIIALWAGVALCIASAFAAWSLLKLPTPKKEAVP